MIPDGDTKDLFVRVEINRQSEISDVKENVNVSTIADFNSHIFIELRKMSKEALE